MTNLRRPIRAHVHWIMKVITIAEIVILPYKIYAFWRSGLPIESFLLLLFLLLAIWVFFLADTKIDVDQDKIQITAPHGVYMMYWSEIKSVETKWQTTYFFGNNKALGYTLLLGGKGKKRLQKYVAEVFRQRGIPIARPEGVTNSQLRKLVRNTKVRGFKLF